MLTLIEVDKTRRVTEYHRPASATRAVGAKAHRQRAGVYRRRRQKVLCIRRQLRADRYNIESRLDAVLEKVLIDLAN